MCNMKDFEPGSFGFHELLDRAYLAAEFQRECSRTPRIRAPKDQETNNQDRRFAIPIIF